MNKIKRIAIWSGPRNLSTALMRSFGNRNDFEVIDEPFYAAYLKETGIKHPMYEEIIDSQTSDPDVICELCKNGPVGKPYQYQKHMTHHMVKKFNRDFIFSLTNIFLIRKPELVLKSFKKKHSDYRLEDLGFKQQFELFELVKHRLGIVPPVIDSEDLMKNPKKTLKNLCSIIDIGFSESMLSWEPGPKPYDGIWGSHWYKEINKSDRFKKITRFDRTPIKSYGMSVKELNIIKEADKYYQHLSKIRINLD